MSVPASEATLNTSARTGAVPAVPGGPPAASGTTPMDAAFIERNQIVERYLSGRLPPRGAADFERFCRENPETLHAMGLPERVGAGLRLMEAAGAPEPWAEKVTPGYQKPIVIAGLAALAGTMMIAAVMLLLNNGAQEKQISVLEDQITNQPLNATTVTRTLVMEPARGGPVSRPMVTFGGTDTELADMKIDVSWSRYTNFRVEIDRVDQGRVLLLGNLERDSNGHLRIALNSSALGPGDYSITMDGLDWKGIAHPQAWASFALAR